jgi:hypothetical protein
LSTKSFAKICWKYGVVFFCEILCSSFGLSEPFHKREEFFIPFFHRVLTLQEDLKKISAAAMSDNNTPTEFSIQERTAYLLFFIHAFQSLEDPVVRKCCLRLSSLWIWRGINQDKPRGH